MQKKNPRAIYFSRFVLILFLAIITGEATVRLASSFLLEVKYVATDGIGAGKKEFSSLREFLQTINHLIPYRHWQNYLTNSLGFNDKEFEAPKPTGRFRIMALGDSFCYGMCPYPQNVMTQLEEKLQNSCTSMDLDLLNFGAAGMGPREYKMTWELGHRLYNPDLLILHFYLGNDGPNTFRHTNNLQGTKNVFAYSYLFTFLKNSLNLFTGLENGSFHLPAIAFPKDIQNNAALEPGSKIDPAVEITDTSPNLAGPTFTQRQYAKILAKELGGFYVPKDVSIKKDWDPILAVLDEIKAQADESGTKFVMILFPSALQVYSRLVESYKDMISGFFFYRGMDFENIDLQLPNRILLEYCKERKMECLDLTPAFQAEALTSKTPLYIERETHWNIRGNLIAAAAEAEFMRGVVCPQAN